MKNNLMHFPLIKQPKSALLQNDICGNKNNIIIVDFVLEATLKHEESELKKLRDAFDSVRETWVLEPAELLEMNRCIFKY